MPQDLSGYSLRRTIFTQGDKMGVALYLAGFYVLVSIFSDGAEKDARWKILAIAIPVTVVLSIAGSVPSLAVFALGCLVAGLLSVVALIFWIKVTKLQALKITGSYIGLVIAYSVVVALILRHAA
jgi:hypothetical protein